MKRSNTLTPAQAVIVKGYVDIYGLAPDQITFDGDADKPIFDHNAISILSLRLTDIADISPTEIRPNNDDGSVTVFGKVTLPDGRTRGCFGIAGVGETLPNGKKIETSQVAVGVATSRCFRQGIRNVGIDLHAAHCQYRDTGVYASSHLARDPRAANYAEIHILATEIGLIEDGDRARYREYLADNFNGRTSAKDLDDIELQRLLTSFRSLANALRKRAA